MLKELLAAIISSFILTGLICEYFFSDVKMYAPSQTGLSQATTLDFQVE